MLEEGRYYLFACPWDWTFVGKFKAIRGPHIVIDHAIYFVRTGARFGELCRSGLVKSGDNKSLYSECGDGISIGNFADTKIFPWHAKVTWSNPDEG